MTKKGVRKPFYKKPEWLIPIIISIILAIFGGKYVFQNVIVGNNNQQILGTNNIQAGGDIIINNYINSTSLCPECPVTTFSEIGLVNHFTFSIIKNGIPTKINTNFYNMRLTLPTGQEIFLDKFLYNESIIFALCAENKSTCYIFPEYRYNKEKDNVCIDAFLDDTWGASGFTIKETKNRASCIQDAINNKFLSECIAE